MKTEILVVSTIIVGTFALVPIPLEPQKPCFTHFGECLRYCPGERIPDVEGIESSCITNTAGYQFCKFYHCPPAKCRGRKKDLYGKCYYCPGQCIDGGRKHNNGEAFLSFDMVNSCFCGQDNSKHCTKHPVDQFSYCNHARPGTDGDNGAVVVVEHKAPKIEIEPKVVAVVQAPPPPPQQQVVAVVHTPTHPQPAPRVAHVPAPTAPPTPPPHAYVPAPTSPPTPPQHAYVPAPTPPQTPPNNAYVPAPTHPPYVPPGVAYVHSPTQPPPFPQHHHQPPPRMVAHPNFQAKSPKSNLNQRSNSHPYPQSVYNFHQSPPASWHGYPQNQQNHGPPSHQHKQYHGPPNNQHFTPNPFFMWKFMMANSSKKEKKEIEL